MNAPNEESGFKVVDRRRVDESGESRETTEARPTADPAQGPITFSLFLQSLGHQCLMSMGIIPWPDGETRQNLDHARETIDVLSILHEKTTGNLTASEQRFFDSVLYELRVTFVKLLEGSGA
jgi:hypothetical protein